MTDDATRSRAAKRDPATYYAFVGGTPPLAGDWPWAEGIKWIPAQCDYCQGYPRCEGSPNLCYGCLLQWAYIGPQYEEKPNA